MAVTPLQVISQLLESDVKSPKNLDLLRKIMLTTYLGRLRINGLSPDNSVSIADYLFDNERVMFDYTRLSIEKKELFLKWCLEDHQNEKQMDYFNGVHINEYRGFTAEVALSWWGRILNWFTGRSSEQWKIADLNLSLEYQLTGLEICHGEQGSLIGFNQLLAPASGTKYKAVNDPQKDPLGNTKRVFLTDDLVDQLIQTDLKKTDFKSICEKPHPQSIAVKDYDARHAEMYNFRKLQKYIALDNWFVRIWKWIVSLFTKKKPKPKNEAIDNKLKLIFENETVKILENELTKKIIVEEKRPDTNNLVLCGGGAKMFAHVGVLKALKEYNIKPKRFAGSSAGAMMSLLSYLNYSPEEVVELFKPFRKEHLIFYSIDINGLSDPHALKTAIDYAIANKIKQIVTKYNIPFPEGKITFATLEELRKQCPDCGLGDELVVTATRMKARQTRYFSFKTAPDFEVSEAVKMSASLPVIFRGTMLDGEEYNDGGILDNFPIHVFEATRTTLLESEYGNNLETLGVQFDNGTERSTLDKLEQVYKENFILNWIYSLLSGVSDPASAWEKDRIKLRKYAGQSIVVNADEVSVSSFEVSEEVRNIVIQKGYDAAKEYLDIRYEKMKDGSYKSEEYMYSSFESLSELLSYCSYRGDKNWFEIVNNLIHQSSAPNRDDVIKHALELRTLYFKDSARESKTVAETQATESVEPNPITFFGNRIPVESSLINERNHDVLLALYPIFQKIPTVFVKNNVDQRTLEIARHALILSTPFKCLDYLKNLKEESHILLYLFIHLSKSLQEHPDEAAYKTLEELQQVLATGTDFLKEEYYAKWDLSFPQCLRVLKLFSTKNYDSLSTLLASLRIREEPLQTVVEGHYYEEGNEEYDEDSEEEDTMSFKP